MSGVNQAASEVAARQPSDRERPSLDRPASRRRFITLAVAASELPVVIVGGGAVGTRKAVTLVEQGADVQVVSPTLSPRLAELAAVGRIRWVSELYRTNHLDGARLVVAATSDRDLNSRIARDAGARGLLVCQSSSAAESPVLFPAIHVAGTATVAIHTGGTDPGLAKRLRDEIGELLSGVGGGATGPLPSEVFAGSATGLLRPLARTSQTHATQGASRQEPRPVHGKVYLVGAGPGSPDLITVRGLRALREASWVIADSLLPDGYLDDLGIASSTKVTCLEHSDTRDRHEAIMEQIALAVEAGQVVARLKNGDPFLFGRGCEEIEFLAARSIAWEVVPGISVCTAGPTLAGLPMTSRSRGRSFAVVTARCSGGDLNRAYPRADTLIFFMGVGALPEITEGLIRDGWASDTPAAILSRVSLAWERRCSGPLDHIAAMAGESQVASPAIVVVGEAAAREQVLPRRPRILFAGEHPEEYAHLGELIHWPALIVEPAAERAELARRLEELNAGRFGWIAFTDATSIRFFFREVDRRGLDSRLLGGLRIAVGGRFARHLLHERGLRADHVIEDEPRSHRDWAGGVDRGSHVLICRDRSDPPVLERAVRAAAGIPVPVAVTERRPHPDLGLPVPAHDVVLFTRPGEATAYVQVYGGTVLAGDVWCLREDTRSEVDALGHAAHRRPVATAAIA